MAASSRPKEPDNCVLDARAATGEGPVWSVPEQALWWVDIPACRLNRFDPSSGENRVFEMPSPIGCFALRESGGLVVALCEGWYAFDPASGGLERWHDPEPERAGNRFNDGTTDPAGRFWAGTMPKAGAGPDPEGALYRLDLDRSSQRIVDGLFVQNGIAFSPGGRTMYLADSVPHVRTIWAFDYDLDSGEPSNRRVFFDTNAVAGRPDGGAVDAEGCYWMAGVGGWQLVRLTPSGKIDRTIAMPVERPTKVAFGGPGLDTLYVTSIGTPVLDPEQPDAGGIFALHIAGVTGLAATPDRG